MHQVGSRFVRCVAQMIAQMIAQMMARMLLLERRPNLRPNLRPNFWCIFTMNMTGSGVRDRSKNEPIWSTFWIFGRRFGRHLGDDVGKQIQPFWWQHKHFLWNMKVSRSITFGYDSLYDKSYWTEATPQTITFRANTYLLVAYAHGLLKNSMQRLVLCRSLMDGWPAGYDGCMATIHDWWMEEKRGRLPLGPGSGTQALHPHTSHSSVTLHPA